MMHDLPIGYVVATVSICAAVVMVCLVCIVAWAPSFRDDPTVFLLDEDEPDHTFGQPPSVTRYGAPPANLVDFHQRAAKGFGTRKGRTS